MRIRELIEPLGFTGSTTIIDDYLREVHPIVNSARTFQRTIYRPGEVVRCDLWGPSAEIPVGHGQLRKVSSSPPAEPHAVPEPLTQAWEQRVEAEACHRLKKEIHGIGPRR